MNVLVKSVESHLKRVRFSEEVIALLRHVLFRFFLALLKALFERTRKTTFNLAKVERIHVPSMAHVHVHSAENCVYHLSTSSFGGFLIGLTCRGHEDRILSLESNQ
jgi:hypothetical protein